MHSLALIEGIAPEAAPITPPPTTSEPAPIIAPTATHLPPTIEQTPVTIVASTTPAAPLEEGKPQGQNTLWLIIGLALVAVVVIALAAGRWLPAKKANKLIPEGSSGFLSFANQW